MKRKCFPAVITVALLLSGCGASIATTRSTWDPSAVIDFNGLQWLVGQDQNTDWYEAKEWVDGLGSNWRMPTLAELKCLWEAGINSDNWGPFRHSGLWVWSGEVFDSSVALAFGFGQGEGYSDYSSYSNSNALRAFAVRYPQ